VSGGPETIGRTSRSRRTVLSEVSDVAALRAGLFPAPARTGGDIAILGTNPQRGSATDTCAARLFCERCPPCPRLAAADAPWPLAVHGPRGWPRRRRSPSRSGWSSTVRQRARERCRRTPRAPRAWFRGSRRGPSGPKREHPPIPRRADLARRERCCRRSGRRGAGRGRGPLGDQCAPAAVRRIPLAPDGRLRRRGSRSVWRPWSLRPADVVDAQVVRGCSCACATSQTVAGAPLAKPDAPFAGLDLAARGPSTRHSTLDRARRACPVRARARPTARPPRPQT
jgi:hypothetical protein